MPRPEGILAGAGAGIPIVTTIAKAYSRGHGFDDEGDPNDELAALNRYRVTAM